MVAKKKNKMNKNHDKIRKVIKESFKESVKDLNESSISRIWQHIKSDRSFGVISAYVIGLGEKDNQERHNNLKQDVKSLKLGYVEQISGYSYEGEDNQVKEKSLFIPNISLDQLLKLGKKYEQESVVYKDSDRFDLIKVSSGSAIVSFQKKNTPLTFDKNVLKNAYSQFIKSKNKNRLKPFAFKVLEVRIPGLSESILASKDKKLAKVNYIPLF